MADADSHGGPDQDWSGDGPPKKPAKKPAPAGETSKETRRLGRPPHPVPLKQRPVSIPDDLWAWSLAQPEGASALVRALLESERNRRAGAFYETSIAAGYQTMEVRTPFGDVTVLEMPGAGVLLLRDDERRHSFGYLADAGGWRFTFGEGDVRGMLRVPAGPAPGRTRAAKRRREAKRRRPLKAVPG